MAIFYLISQYQRQLIIIFLRSLRARCGQASIQLSGLQLSLSLLSQSLQ